MSARHSKDDPINPGPALTALTWFGGGTVADPEGRSGTPFIGALVLLGGVVAWLIAAGVTVAATGWPVAVAFSAALVFAALVVLAVRTTVSSTRGMLGRIAVAVAVGLVVGELSSMLLFGGAITQHLERQALERSASTPAVASAAADLDTQRAARKALDEAVDSARGRRDEAQVVARCEFQPEPSCPQQSITGVAGDGQITQNTQEVLDQDQHELDAALAARDRQAPALDARITDAEHSTALARQSALAGADQGFGARWVAMNAYTLSAVVALSLRVLTAAACVLLYLLPLLLHTRQDRTLRERHSQSRLRAELQAETAIAVKRAEVRAAAEILQAEHQLTTMKTALEADAEISREYHRQRVAEARTAQPAALAAQVLAAPVELMPIEAAAAAAASEPAALPVAAAEAPTADSRLPVPADAALPVPAASVVPAKSGGLPSIPVLPDIAGAAVRFLRPLVPPVITQVVETSTQQLRSAQKVLEEFEELTFSFRRTTRVIVQETEEQRGTGGEPAPNADPSPTLRHVDSARDYPTIDTRVINAEALGSADITPAVEHTDRRQLRSGPRAIDR